MASPKSGASSAELPVCCFVDLGLEDHAQEDSQPGLKQCPLSSSQGYALEAPGAERVGLKGKGEESPGLWPGM